jgi:dolichol-phosphate mannosyltransferase
MNEEETLPKLLDSIFREFSTKDYCVIVINDGSTDRTGSVAESFQKKGQVIVLHNDGNKGLGFTMLRGLREVASRAESTDAVVTMDADNTHGPECIHEMLRRIEDGDDLVIASRFQTGSVVRGVPFAREFLSWGASFTFRVLFSIPSVRDFTCGFRAYRAGLIQTFCEDVGPSFQLDPGFSSTVQLLLRLSSYGPRVSEIPFSLRYDRKESQSKMKIMRTLFETLRLIVREKRKGQSTSANGA